MSFDFTNDYFCLLPSLVLGPAATAVIMGWLPDKLSFWKYSFTTVWVLSSVSIFWVFKLGALLLEF